MLQHLTKSYKTIYLIALLTCCFILFLFYTDTTTLSNYTLLVPTAEENLSGFSISYTHIPGKHRSLLHKSVTTPPTPQTVIQSVHKANVLTPSTIVVDLNKNTTGVKNLTTDVTKLKIGVKKLSSNAKQTTTKFNDSNEVEPSDDDRFDRETEAPFDKLSTPLADLSKIDLYKKAGFLVYSTKCKIVDLDPFNNQAKEFFKPEKYLPCRKLELLTYITKTDNVATLHIDQEIVPSYSSSGVCCCYSNVTRDFSKTKPDDVIKISKCQKFNDNTTISEEVVTIKCKDKSKKKEVYENTHATITIRKNVQKKIDRFLNNTSTKPISILFIGIDSISRLNFIRTMPNTYKFVTQNNWLPLKGYNKMGDNTFPNVMAILTGYNESRAYAICNPKEVGYLDSCKLLWFDYGERGYITGYAEDETSINTFNYRKKGFTKPPTDYYLRPYMMAAEKHKTIKKDSMTYCSGPETSGERILNVAKDFAVTFKDYPMFGFFWMNTYSHNELNSPSRLDNKVKLFLEDLTNSGVVNNSIIMFVSDHGMRFGDIRKTPTGWFEERLPFIYLSFPPSFKVNFPEAYNNFKSNEHKLTVPYDLHMTLQHILVMSGFNYTIKSSDGCPECRSLFEKIEVERSCEDAHIEQHWCTCSGYKNIELDQSVAKTLGTYVVDQIQNIISSKNGSSNCAKYSLSKIISINLSEKFSYKNDSYLLIVFETEPQAVFETTVAFKGNVSNAAYSISGGISRLDSYNAHSKCTSDAYLKKYCYCV